MEYKISTSGGTQLKPEPKVVNYGDEVKEEQVIEAIGNRIMTTVGRLGEESE